MMSYITSLRRLSSLTLILFCLVCALTSCRKAAEKTPPPAFEMVQKESNDSLLNANDIVPEKNIDVPDYVYEILIYIRTHNKAPEGYVGGRVFQNRERRLPVTDDAGYRIRYREWDVHRKIRGKNRGSERLITSGNSAYYTGDHYRTFIHINETYLKEK